MTLFEYGFKSVLFVKHGKGARKPRAPLQEYTVGLSMDRVSVDILGPFVVSKSNCRFCLAIQDNFTKFVEAYGISDQTAETVANNIVLEFF